ncbi:hypothetical protein GCWU000322_00348 [Eubacterium saphenum ATCC 49989]|nr:hypothetical protein GCWU000322_00350 [Eubacterium saphenum ATCC 49989]EEU03703.1 hypothetical protein GCWU000322_00348 [Eubacterium saphenum ATCC 49989]
MKTEYVSQEITKVILRREKSRKASYQITAERFQPRKNQKRPT